MPTDQHQRQQALDITQSFIVQAPAGSGKTELLTQRYLALLAQAKFPEEIIAITFTNKAAAEMRTRILETLQTTASSSEPNDSAYHQQRWQLAQAVLQQDHKKNWQLLDNPNRLRIQTIDSLCATLTKQMPVLSNFGTQPTIADDIELLYTRAARSILQDLESHAPWNLALTTLLLHLDNDFNKVEKLFCAMLAKRDQWSSHIFNQSDRKALEKTLKNSIDETLGKLRALPQSLCDELFELLEFSQQQLETGTGFSKQDFFNQATWIAMSTLLLTQENTWRKKVDKKTGFPPEAKAMKNRITTLLQQLADNDDLREILIDIRMLPPPQYTETQWQIVDASIALLRALLMQLQVVFQTTNSVDYIEVAQRALTALGEPENPTDLALILDYQIQHILVDEFQDTSIPQLRLLEQLTAGWQPEDGRTLFLVGDPMQSIYRFRKAEVGLFLQIRRQGLGDIHLTPLTLTANFRSSHAIVDWINQTFSTLLPKQENIHHGAVSYSASTTTALPNEEVAVISHWLTAESEENEANRIVNIIQQSLDKNPQDRIAILVRTRTHLPEIIKALREHQLPYRAVEIETLAQDPLVQDLLALTRALLHPADRVAWLAILRAPWCGLTLHELHTMAFNNHQTTVWECLQNYQSFGFNAATQQRLKRLVTVFEKTLQHRHRQPLAHWVKGTWTALGGPACIRSSEQLDDIKTFFALLEKLTPSSNVIEIKQLNDNLNKLFASTNTQANIQIEVMTIHKAKGLEFDTVILPELNRKTQNDDSQLLFFSERRNANGDTDLLMAPIRASTEEKDLIYDYLKYEENKKNTHEITRLLYVAATRAKKYLHLLATLKYDDEESTAQKPAESSLLAQLWPTLSAITQTNKLNAIPLAFALNNHHALPLKRLTANWQLPTTPQGLQPLFNQSNIHVAENIITTAPLFQRNTQRHIGTVVHKLLQQISLASLGHWHESNLNARKPYFAALLLQTGISPEEIPSATQTVMLALTKILQDPRGRWILDNQHLEANSEYPLSVIANDQVIHMIMDRTFIDEKGTRWIIDYKTTDITNEFGNYRPQLEKYAESMRKIDTRPINLGLYFPLLTAWYEWEYK